MTTLDSLLEISRENFKIISDKSKDTLNIIYSIGTRALTFGIPAGVFTYVINSVNNHGYYESPEEVITTGVIVGVGVAIGGVLSYFSN